MRSIKPAAEGDWTEALLWVCFLVVAMTLRGLCLMVLWGWFVVPMGVLPIGAAHAIGLSVVCHAMLPPPQQTDKKREMTAVIVAQQLLTLPLAVLIAYPLTWFM